MTEAGAESNLRELTEFSEGYEKAVLSTRHPMKREMGKEESCQSGTTHREHSFLSQEESRLTISYGALLP